MLASALKNHYVFAAVLLVAAGAALHLGADLFQPAFAEQSPAAAIPDANTQQAPTGNSYYRSVSESLSVVASHGSGSGTTSSPQSYYRSVSESMSVTSVQGKAPNSYTRSMSEQASLTTGMPSSAPAGPQVRAAPAPYSASSSQRIDERTSFRNLAGGKTDSTYRSTAGTSVYSDSMSVSYELSGSDAGIIIQDTASVDGGESEAGDSSSIAKIIAANLAADQYQAGYSYATNVIFGVQELAVVAIALGRSSAVRKVPRTSNLRVLVAIFTSPSEKAPAQTRILVMLVVLFSAAAATSSFAGPILGEAAGDTNKAAIVYIEGSTPIYREWIPSSGGGGSWSSAVSLTAADTTLNTVKIEFSPTSSKRVIVTMDNNGNLDSYVCFSGCTDTGNWTHGDNFADVTTTTVTASRRPWDIEYEQTSGDLMVVYDYTEAGSSATDDLFYRIMTDSQTSFGSESTINDSGNAATAGLYAFVAMDSQKTSGSDEMALIAVDATGSDVSAIVWNGADWTTLPQTELSTAVSIATEEAVAIAYESSSGDILVVAGEGSTVRHNTFSNTSDTWGTSSTTTGTWAVGVLNWMKLVPDPRRTSDAIFLGGLGASSDLDSAYWSGSAWTDHGEHDAGVTGNDKRYFDFTWDGSSSNGVLAWSTATNSISFTRGDPSSGAFGTDGTFTVDSGGANAAQWIRLVPNPTAADTVAALGLESDVNSDIGGITWDGGANAPVSTGTDDISTTSTTNGWEPFDIDFQEVVVSRSMSESMGMSDSVVAARLFSAPVSEAAAVSDSIAITDGVFTRSVTEQLGITDSIEAARSFLGSVSEQASLSDTIQADQTFGRSISEQAGLQDRIKRDLNGYSAGTAYISDTGDFGLSSPKYRQWDPTDEIWSYEVELPDTGSDIRDVRIAFSPVNEMRVVVSHSVDGTLNLFKCDAVCIDESSWTLVAADFADTGTPSSTRPFRYFDIGFEQLSGELLIAYDRTVTQANDLYYRTYDGSTLAAESGHNYFGPIELLDAEVIPFIRIASKPSSDEMAVAIQDFTRQDAYAVIFDATTGTPSTTNQVTLTSSMGTTSIEGEAVGIAYEPGNGRAVAFSSNGFDSMAYATWDGTSWSSMSTVDPNSGASSHIKFMSVKASPSPTNDVIMVCQVDDQSDLTCAEMENGSLGSFTVIDSDVNSMTTRPFDFVWNQAGSSATLAWGTSADVVNWAVWNGSSWGSSSTTSMTGTHQWIVADEAPSNVETTKAVFLAMNSAFDIGSLGIVGSSLTLLGDTSHTTETTGTTFEGMDIDWHFAGRRQPFRLLTDQLAVTETLAINVIKPLSEAMALTDTITAVRAVSKVVAENLAVAETTSMVVAKPLSESAALTDTITAVRVITVTLTEQLGMADTIARSFTGSRSASEQLGVTESVTKTVAVVLNEQLGLVDSIIRFFTIDRPISEQLSMTDAIAIAVSKSLIEQAAFTESSARSVVQTRTISEQMAFTDTTSIEASKPLAEQLGVTDTIARSIISARSVSEQLAATDSVTKTVTFVLTENLGMAESTDRVIMVSRSMTEQLGMAESTTKAASIALSEQLGVFDAMARSIVTSRTLLEQLAVTEALAASVSKPLAEQLAMTEQLARSIISAREMTEQLAATEAVTVIVSKGLSEQLAMSDSVQRSIVTARTLTEQLGATETVAKAFSVAVSEQMELTETAARSTVQSASFTEQLAVSDTLAKSVPKSLSEQMTITEDAARTIVLARTMSEQLVVSDAVSKNFAAELSEQMTLTESAARSVVQSRSMSEELALTDAVVKAVATTLTEQMALEDTLARTVTLTRTAAESLALQDAIAKAASMAVAEQLSMTETAARSVVQSRSMQEQLALSDAIAVATVKSLSESLDMTDAIARSVVQSVTLTEQMATQDTVAVSIAKEISEQLILTDALARSATVSRPATEQLGVADAISVAVSRSTADQLALTDEVARSVVQSRSMSEELAATDSVAIVVTEQLVEQLAATDTLTRMVVQSRSISEQLGLSETAGAQVTSRAISESLSVADSVSMTVSRSMSEQLNVTESISISAPKSMTESLAVADSVTMGISRSMTEQIGVVDAITISVVKQLSESLGMTDAVTRSAIQSTSLTEQLVLSDAIAAQITSRTASETLTLTDSISMALSRSMTEQLGMGESISTGALTSRAESLAMAESVSIHVSKSMTEQLGISDAAVATISAVEVTEGMTVSDAVSITVSRAASDQLGVTESLAIAIGKSVADSMAISDAILLTAPGAATESLSITESIVARPAKPLSDQLGVTDSIAIAVAMSLADQLAMTDSAIAVTAGDAFVTEQLGATESISIRVTKQMNENLALSESIMTAGSAGMAESMAVTDAISRSLVTARMVSEGLSVQDSAAVVNVILVFVADALELDEAFTDISIVFNLILGPEGLVLAQGFATNVEGMFDQADNEGIVIGADVALALESATTMTEALALQDQIIASQGPARGFSDSLAVSDGIIATSGVTAFINDSFSMTSNTDFMVEPAPTTAPGSPLPPISVLIVTDGENVDQIPGVSVPGIYSYNGNVTELAEQLLPLPHHINATVSRPDLPAMTMVLPTYHIPITPSPEIPGEDVLMTVMAAEIPADTPVLVPVSMESTPGMETDIPWINIEFTPAVNTTNFALIVSVVEEPPTGAQEPQADLKPIYLDVRWIGDFPGAEDPSVEEYYANPPRFIFAVPEEWAMEQDAQRNEDGVPMVSLGLLDEDTGEWETIEDIDMPAGLENGEYVYVAHLNHFSTYVITANQATTSEDDGSSGRGAVDYARSLTESMLVSSAANMGIPIESSGKIVIKDISDSLMLRVIQPQPLHQRVITVQNMTVAVSVQNVESAPAFGTAVATLDFEITNDNNVEEELVLRYWYSDQSSGERLYEGDQTVMVGAGQSLNVQVDVPFYSPGIFDLMVEAESKDGTIATTDVTVNVPWLSVYVYALIGIALAVTLISLFYVLWMLQRLVIEHGLKMLVAALISLGLLLFAWRRRRRLYGKLDLMLYDEFGNLKDERHFENPIVNTKFEDMLYRISPNAGLMTPPWNYVAIGTGTKASAAGETALVSELKRLRDTEAEYTKGKQLKLQVTFGAGQGTGNVAEIGLFNAAQGGDMLARQTFTPISKGSSDILTVTWIIMLSTNW